MRRLLPLLLLLTATALAAPAGALADAGLSASAGQLTLTSDSGVAAKLVIAKRTGAFDCGNAFSAGCIQLTDPKPIRLGNSGCVVPTAAGAVACAPLAFASIKLVLGDGDDSAFVADGVIPVIMDGGSDDDNLVSNGGSDTLLGGSGNDSLNDIGDNAGGDDAIDGGTGNDQILVGFGDDSIRGGGDVDSAVLSVGNDTVRLDDVANDGRPGEAKNVHSDLESVNGGTGNDTLVGNAGANQLRGGPGIDTIDAGPGDDVVEGGTGSDDLAGGAGRDRVDYPEVAAQRISLDGVRDDGAPGELDKVHADVEDVAAGAGDDTLIGSGAANRLDGGPGADRIEGGAGEDELLGGPGADTLLARDGLRETIDCGADSDTGEGDTTDELAGCEAVALSTELIADADGDGAAKPEDCDDGNPAIRPGVVDTPENGIDEDCSGADAVDLDRDRDGFLRPTDCDDANAAIHPGARDIPGNPINEDCTDGPAPFPLIGSIATGIFDAPGNFTRMVAINVRRPRKGSTLRITCKGGGCPFKTRTRKITRNSSKSQILDRPLGKAKLRRGTRVELRLTKPGTVGFFVRFTIGRPGKFPPKVEKCLAPGTTRPGSCPA